MVPRLAVSADLYDRTVAGHRKQYREQLVRKGLTPAEAEVVEFLMGDLEILSCFGLDFFIAGLNNLE